MAFREHAHLKGFDRTFAVSPEARPYTLRDNGFVNTRQGNFEYERELDSTDRRGLVLKVRIDKDLKGLSIATTTNRGFNTVDVNKLKNNEMIIEKINFIFDGFVDRNCLIEVK